MPGGLFPELPRQAQAFTEPAWDPTADPTWDPAGEPPPVAAATAMAAAAFAAATVVGGVVAVDVAAEAVAAAAAAAAEGEGSMAEELWTPKPGPVNGWRDDADLPRIGVAVAAEVLDEGAVLAEKGFRAENGGDAARAGDRGPRAVCTLGEACCAEGATSPGTIEAFAMPGVMGIAFHTRPDEFNPDEFNLPVEHALRPEKPEPGGAAPLLPPWLKVADCPVVPGAPVVECGDSGVEGDGVGNTALETVRVGGDGEGDAAAPVWGELPSIQRARGCCCAP